MFFIGGAKIPLGTVFFGEGGRERQNYTTLEYEASCSSGKTPGCWTYRPMAALPQSEKETKELYDFLLIQLGDNNVHQLEWGGAGK